MSKKFLLFILLFFFYGEISKAQPSIIRKIFPKKGTIKPKFKYKKVEGMDYLFTIHTDSGDVM